ncbi:flagella synthesis protein FlgN [Alkalilimnicola sp. S0819]|uniref:flagella synthesis protein FlgN n=1 Tax=Alkalilimnicola sp. S0819 TaxID=2613922 RepID=UPI00186A2746|nr:flagellar protein FlgN [Alkalilimnicola sp. S0819]
MAGLLTQTLAACEELTVVLGDEQRSIADADGDALPALIQRKLELLQQLESLEQDRRRLLGHEAAANEGAMQAFIAGCARGDALEAQWQALLGQLRQLQAVNEASGALINRGLHQTEASLSVLTGRDRQNTYESGGQRPGYGPGRELSRA